MVYICALFKTNSIYFKFTKMKKKDSSSNLHQLVNDQFCKTKTFNVITALELIDKFCGLVKEEIESAAKPVNTTVINDDFLSELHFKCDGFDLTFIVTHENEK